MGTLWEAMKKGNTSSATAALGNTGLAVVKGFAAAFSGSGAMFASAMHSVADAINQGFVFFGSVLGEKKPTPKFPTGFGRVINLFCMIAVVMTQFTTFTILDGIATILIGFLMIGVAFRVGYDNMVGLIGVAAPKDVELRVARSILDDPDVTDINRMRIVQEGRFYHVECYMELRPGLLLSVADDIKFRVRDKLLKDPDISDVTLGILEDNGITDWKPTPTPDAPNREKSR